MTCVDDGTCFPQMPLDVFNLYDIQYGAGMSIVMMALIIGGITLAIYVKNRSLPMLGVLGIYEFAAFGSIITSQYVASQYQFLPYVIGLSVATGIVMLFLRLVKE